MSHASNKKCLDDSIMVDTSNAPLGGWAMTGGIVAMTRCERRAVKP
jgi:hypothetical protein